MKLPQLNLRIAERHHNLIREIAQLLRESGGDTFAADLGAFLDGRPAPAAYAGDPALAGRMDDLEQRLAELEGWRQSLTDPEPLADTVQVRPRKNDPFPEHVLIDADKLNRAGNTWEDIARTMNLRQTANGLRNAVKKWRERQDQDWAKGA